MQEKLVHLERDESGIATLLLNRPEKLNAFTVAMIQQWHEALVQAVEDSEIKVIVLTGAGRAFCAGGDMDDILQFRTMDSIARKDYLWRHVHNIVRVLERCEKPVIAAVNGAARGAGMDMALMCDLRVVAESATFAESYINLGLIAGDAGTYFLPRLIGTARALELFWTGRTVSSQEAERIGIANRVVPDAELLTVTHELARQIAAQPQEAIRCFKRAVYQSATMPLAAHLDMVSSHMAILEDTAEHRDRVTKFLEARGR